MAAIPHLSTAAVAARAKLREEDVRAVFEVITSSIEEGVEVRIADFGSFVPYQRPSSSITSPLIRGGQPTPRKGGRSMRLRVARKVLERWQTIKETA